MRLHTENRPHGLETCSLYFDEYACHRPLSYLILSFRLNPEPTFFFHLNVVVDSVRQRADARAHTVHSMSNRPPVRPEGAAAASGSEFDGLPRLVDNGGTHRPTQRDAPVLEDVLPYTPHYIGLWGWRQELHGPKDGRVED